MREKLGERKQAVLLRKQGLSYTEIQKTVPVSQASLSLWLTTVPLTRGQKVRLAKLALKGQAAGAAARRTQRLTRLSLLADQVSQELPALILNPFFTFGLALYWAEGSKQKPWSMSHRAAFSNSDPALVLLMRQWFETFCYVPKDQFIYRLHIHQTANVPVAIEQWSELLNIAPEKICVTLKKNEVLSRHKHDHYKGLIHMVIRKSTWLNRRIELWTKGAASTFST